jgi:hypothetical protein
MRVRINNIECRKYTATKTDDVHYEIIKWVANEHFGKEKEYREEGYVDSFGGDFLQKNGHSIQKTFFTNKETCFTVASLQLNRREPDVYLESVGSRMLDLDDQEMLDFIEVYRIASPKITKKHFRNNSDD